MKTLGALAMAGALIALPSVSSAAVFGTNLIVNGDAESGAGSAGGYDIVPVPGFTTTGTFTVVQYTAGGGFPVAGDPGVSMGAINFFTGGPSATVSTAAQAIDVSAGALQIDLGLVSFDLSALLGGFDSQGDNAVLTLDFLSAASTSLGGATLGPVTNGDRGNQTGLLARSTGSAIPVGTRSIGILLTMTRLAGTYDDGYADNLSLVLNSRALPGAVPEPASWAMMIGGFALAGAALRRRTRTIAAVG